MTITSGMKQFYGARTLLSAAVRVKVPVYRLLYD